MGFKRFNLFFRCRGNFYIFYQAIIWLIGKIWSYSKNLIFIYCWGFSLIEPTANFPLWIIFFNTVFRDEGSPNNLVVWVFFSYQVSLSKVFSMLNLQLFELFNHSKFLRLESF
jgi:hypothetical protein